MRTSTTVSRSAAFVSRRGLSVSSWTTAVVLASAVAWLGALVLMRGMDEGPGTPLGNMPAFLLAWFVMLTAMMLPSELTYIGAFAAMLRGRGVSKGWRRNVIACFVLGYGAAWIAYGVIAYILDGAVRMIMPEMIAWYRVGPFLAGPLLAGSTLVAAGFYQVSSLKHVCLTGCRSPLSFFARYWRRGKAGALAMGFRHGLVCVGCCWALMAVMFAVGTMSLTWMALLTVFMFAEKVLPKGQVLARPIAYFLWGMGIWIAVSPETAPLLKTPMVSAGSICNLF
jgi:predicted metal-binding membrane protein